MEKEKIIMEYSIKKLAREYLKCELEVLHKRNHDNQVCSLCWRPIEEGQACCGEYDVKQDPFVQLNEPVNVAG
jgi:hypothetical protein